MTFKTLKQIIQTVEQQPSWKAYQQFRLVLDTWSKIVEPVTADHSRPYALERQILWVSTPNSVWAQNLSLQRRQLLKKLNQELSEPIQQLKFSTVHWQQPKSNQPLTSEPSCCPQCQRLTPSSELNRWSVCAFCIVQYWNKNEI